MIPHGSCLRGTAAMPLIVDISLTDGVSESGAQLAGRGGDGPTIAQAAERIDEGLRDGEAEEQFLVSEAKTSRPST
jgi:hypothetical protein